MEMIYKNKIKIDNCWYELFIKKDYEIGFSRLYGSTKKGKIEYTDMFGHDNPDCTLTNDTDNPVKVIRTILNKFVDLVYKYNLPYFTFTAREPKRAMLYKKIITRFLKNNPKSGYDYYENKSKNKNEFLFIRTKQKLS